MTDGPLSTGIAGLDQLLRGGLVRNRLYLIEGKPGTGKTTIAMQFLLEGIRQGETTLYVTLSETRSELHAAAASHGWSLDGIELIQLPVGDSLKAADQYTLFHPSEIELGETIKAVLEFIAQMQPARVVLDSLSELKLLAGDPFRFRRQILALKDFFAERSCTVLLLDDLSDRDNNSQLQSTAHGVLLLEQLPFDYGRVRRRMRVVKFRGVAAVEGFHDFTIKRGGVVVFPRLTVASGSAVRPRETLQSGITALDELLGGGLNWGTTTVVIGPAGTGKSTLAAQYVAAVGADHAGAAAFLFDERKSSFVGRCDAIGLDMGARIAAGRLTIEQIETGELSPGEFSYRVRDSVERGARLVLIDSLNGYLNAIPQNDAPIVRMHELLSFLSENDVATILIVAQHGIVGTAMGTPIDVSYLADTVVLLRFFEAFGAVRRAISVVKKRSSLHETTIREFQIGPERIRVGAVLTEFQGVLTGVPRYVGAAGPLLRNEQ